MKYTGSVTLPRLVCTGESVEYRNYNRFWDRQKPQSFWGRPCFRLQTSGHLPCQGKGVHPAKEGFTTASGAAILGSLIPPRLAAQVRVWTTEATQLLGQAPFQALIFCQEAGPNARYLGTFPARGKLACRECSTTETQKRASLPGLLIEANRIMGGISSNQRQL